MALYKITNVKCKEFDKAFSTISLCDLKLVTRGVVSLNINIKLHKTPVDNVMVRTIERIILSLKTSPLTDDFQKKKP